MRVQSVNNNQNQYKQNFQMKIKGRYFIDDVLGVFGCGPVAIAKRLVKQDSELNRIGDETTLLVAARNLLGFPATKVIARLKAGKKIYEGTSTGKDPFEKNFINIANEAIARLNSNKGIGIDDKYI